MNNDKLTALAREANEHLGRWRRSVERESYGLPNDEPPAVHQQRHKDAARKYHRELNKRSNTP